MIILERSMILMGRYEQYANNRVGLLQEIVIAFAIQVLPIILYRFFVKKTDIKKSTSSVVSVVSFFVTVVGLIILGRRRYIPYTLLLAFSFLDYWFLTMKTTGLGQSKTSDNIMNDTKAKGEMIENGPASYRVMTGTINGQPSQPAVFCRKCGNRIEPDSLYCSFCGEKTILALENAEQEVQ